MRDAPVAKSAPAPALAALEGARARPAPVPQVIPDGCNLGTLLRASLGVNAAMVAGTLAAQSESGQFSAAFLSVAAVVEPVTLLTLLAWCGLRRAAPPISVPVQRSLAWAVPGALAAAVLWLLLGPGPSTRSVVASGTLVALAAGIAAQHYFELRARAFSPAMAEAKLQALQSRIRPHFLFNSLNAVLAVVRDDPPRAERMLENLAELFRAVMGDVRELVPLEKELDLCRQYVEIEQSRLGDRLQVSWQIAAVHPRARVPQLLLQPIIENAVRYGAERQAGVCDIEVKIRQRGFQLEIGVSNPIAREPIQREGNQIGLNNIRGRLALIYDLEARLETRVRRGRFELLMSIPVENKAG
jgi:two-component system, LytTR family, sensor histidine kinase AlgZ